MVRSAPAPVAIVLAVALAAAGARSGIDSAGALEFLAPGSEASLFPSEGAFLANNTLRFAYQEFDRRLDDLTGGRP